MTSTAKHTQGPFLYAMDARKPNAYTNALWSNSEPNPHILTFNVSHPDADNNARMIAAAANSYDKHCGAHAVEYAEADLLGEALEAVALLLPMAKMLPSNAVP